MFRGGLFYIYIELANNQAIYLGGLPPRIEFIGEHFLLEKCLLIGIPRSERWYGCHEVDIWVLKTLYIIAIEPT